MPSLNITRHDNYQSYYHVYARGINKQRLFLDEQDFGYFVSLFPRYLSSEVSRNKFGKPYANFQNQVELLAYCLMGNHFHMFVYQEKQGALTFLMRSIMVSYSRYFNLKYKRTGPLFESRYKAAIILNDVHLMHITRYIHLNPRYWRRYPYSSLQYYIHSDLQPDWIVTSRILELFKDADDYLQFSADYQDHRDHLQSLKAQLADR